MVKWRKEKKRGKRLAATRHTKGHKRKGPRCTKSFHRRCASQQSGSRCNAFRGEGKGVGPAVCTNDISKRRGERVEITPRKSTPDAEGSVPSHKNRGARVIRIPVQSCNRSRGEYNRTRKRARNARRARRRPEQSLTHSSMPNRRQKGSTQHPAPICDEGMRRQSPDAKSNRPMKRPRMRWIFVAESQAPHREKKAKGGEKKVSGARAYHTNTSEKSDTEENKKKRGWIRKCSALLPTAQGGPREGKAVIPVHKGQEIWRGRRGEGKKENLGGGRILKLSREKTERKSGGKGEESWREARVRGSA